MQDIKSKINSDNEEKEAAQPDHPAGLLSEIKPPTEKDSSSIRRSGCHSIKNQR